MHECSYKQLEGRGEEQAENGFGITDSMFVAQKVDFLKIEMTLLKLFCGHISLLSLLVVGEQATVCA
mgnify:CR=1 FL=1